MPYFVNTRVAKVISQGKKLGIGDHIVTWHKLQTLSQRHDGKEFAALPDNVQVREVHLLIRQQGFDPKLFL